MKVKELIENLRIAQDVEIRKENFFECYTKSNNEVMEIFKECEVIDWFVYIGDGKAIIVINIKSEVE